MPKRMRAGFSAVAPEAAGLSSKPLQRLRKRTDDDVDKVGDCVGGAHIILHRGKCVFAHTNGWADKAKRKRFGFRTLCRMHSNTKAIVAVAFFTLVEKGKVRLSDPVTKYIPFSNQVRKGKLVKRIKKTPTLRHLLTMTSGLKHAEAAPYDDIIKRVQNGKIAQLKTFSEEVAKVPLEHEPGSRHNDHALCVDLLVRVCEVVSGKPIDAFVRQYVLEPLGMKDTFFASNLPSRKIAQIGKMYEFAENQSVRGKLQYIPSLRHCPEPLPRFHTPGGGLYSYEEAGMWSSAQDFAKFCQMLLDGGVSATGRRVLRSSTVKMLWRDSLAPFQRKDGRFPGWNDSDGPAKRHYWDQRAWSLLNTTLMVDDYPPRKGTPRKGHKMWNYGGAGASWEIDARRRLVALTFNQSSHGMYVNENSHTYCMPYAAEAVDEGLATAKKARHK